MAGEKELRVKITADSAQFLNSVKGVNSSLGGLISTVGKFQLSTVGIVAGLSSVGAGLAKIITSTAHYGDELIKSSQKIGMSVEALSGLQYAAKLSDVSNEQLVNGLKRLSLNLFDAARGIKEAKDVFGVLDIALKDANGNLRSTSDVFRDVTDKIQNMKDGTGKTALMMKVFGKAGADLIPLMNEGAKGIKDATDEAAAFGQVISTEAAQAAEEFNDNLSRMTTMAAGVTYSIGNELIPAINNLMTAWIDYSKEVSKTPSVWEEMWSKISPSADLQRKLSGLGIMQGGEFFVGEGPGGTMPKYAEPKTPKGKAPALADEAADKAAETAAQKRLQNLEKWAANEFKFQGEIWNMRWAKIEENDKFMMDAWELEKSIGDQRLAMIEEETRLSIEAAKEKQDAIVGSLAFIGRSALSENKAFFAITKAANIAQATMDTYAAANKAMAQLGAWGWPVAAAIYAAGVANVAKIASTSFGGKGSGGSASGSATSGAGIGAQGSTFVANQPSRSVQVVVHGNIIDHAAFVRELQPYFKEVVVDTV